MLVLPLINFLIVNRNGYTCAGTTGYGPAVLSQTAGQNASTQQWTILSYPQGHAIRSAASPQYYASALQTNGMTPQGANTVQLSEKPYFWQIDQGPSTYPGTYYIWTSDNATNNTWYWDQQGGNTSNNVPVILWGMDNPTGVNQLWSFTVP